MSQQMISRRGALSLLGLAAALGFAVPTTALTTSNAEAQAQPTAPTPQVQPSAPPTAPATSGLERRQQRRLSILRRSAGATVTAGPYCVGSPSGVQSTCSMREAPVATMTSRSRPSATPLACGMCASAAMKSSSIAFSDTRIACRPR
jgi:hypothetical protein